MFNPFELNEQDSLFSLCDIEHDLQFMMTIDILITWCIVNII